MLAARAYADNVSLCLEYSMKATFSPNYSFVIPALNEGSHIGKTLEAIARYAGRPPAVEVIVVDHGSTDGTREVALNCGAEVHIRRGGTIASLRNWGARMAKGDILIFLDADVSLTELWQRRWPAVERMLTDRPRTITGSHCSAPADGGILETNWFRNFATQQNAAHIGTGHLVVPSETFRDIGGFDETLETGEDYEFCRRAVARGVTILNDPQLEVVHRDFPVNLRSFVRREAWHGRGDLRAWADFLGSKVALASVLFQALHVMFVVALWPTSSWMAVIVSVLLLMGLLLGSSIIRFRHCSLWIMAFNAGIFYFYYLGRSAAIWKRAAFLFKRAWCKLPAS